MRDSMDREDFSSGEYAVALVKVEPTSFGERKGDPGNEFTRRIRSDIGVDRLMRALRVTEMGPLPSGLEEVFCTSSSVYKYFGLESSKAGAL